MPNYTFHCKRCGRIVLKRSFDERHETMCNCGRKVSRVPDDFSANMLPAPFKAVRVLGYKGGEHAEISSRSELKAVSTRSYWEEDYDMGKGPHRELMDIKKFGEERGFKEHPGYKTGCTVTNVGRHKEKKK